MERDVAIAPYLSKRRDRDRIRLFHKGNHADRIYALSAIKMGCAATNLHSQVGRNK